MSITQWFASIAQSLDNPQQHGDTVSGSASNKTEIVIDDVQPPAGATLSIRDVGLGSSRYEVILKTGIPPDLLEITADRGLRTLVFRVDSGELHSVIITGAPDQRLLTLPISIEPAGSASLPDGLSLVRGWFNLKPHDAPAHLLISDAHLGSDSQGRYPVVEAEGNCTLPSEVTIDQLRVHPGAVLTMTPSTRISMIQSATDGDLDFNLKGTCTAVLPFGSHVTLLEGATWVIRTDDRVTGISVTGSGTVNVEGELTDCVLTPVVGAHLTLTVSGSAEGLSGDVWLETKDGAVVIGSGRSPVHVRRIVSLERAEVQNVNLFNLESLSNLPELSKLARFSMWLPSDRKDAKRLATEMDLGRGSEATKKQRRAHYWASLTDILKDGHATGRVQSVARYNAMHFRHEHVESGTEKRLLRLYSVVGYGESVLRPLLAILAMCALFTPILVEPPLALVGECCPRLGAYWDTFTTLLLSPLAFFKSPIEPPGDISSWGETFLLVGFQVGSLLMLFFAISAVRRITKAE